MNLSYFFLFRTTSWNKGKSPLRQRKSSSSTSAEARETSGSPESFDQKHEWEKQIEKMYMEKTNAKDLEQLRKDYSLYGSLLFVSLVFYLVSSFGKPWILQQLGERSALKPYKTFDEFYPFYLTQHTDSTCRYNTDAHTPLCFPTFIFILMLTHTPHYVCRTLHFIGTTIVVFMMVKSIDVFLSMIPAALIGYALSTCTADIDNGIIEGGVMMVVFIATNIKISHIIYRPFLVLLVGYGFAWVSA